MVPTPMVDAIVEVDEDKAPNAFVVALITVVVDGSQVVHDVVIVAIVIFYLKVEEKVIGLDEELIVGLNLIFVDNDKMIKIVVEDLLGMAMALSVENN